MEILFVTSELAPYSRFSEAADTTAALAKALRSLGHRVTVVSPLYPDIDPTARSLARKLSPLRADVAGATHSCTVFDGRTTGGVDLVFIGPAELFAARDGGGKARSQAIFGAAAAALVASRDPRPEVVHVKDAACAGVITDLRKTRPDQATVLTLGGSPDDARLAEAISAASAVTVHGATLAAELAHDARSPLAPLLRDKGARFAGVADGVDASAWNPLTDPHLRAHFDPVELSGKARCKGTAQLQFGLAVTPELPLLTVPAGTADLSLLGEIAARALENPMQLLVLGEPYDERLAALQRQRPEQVAHAASPSNDELHLGVAGADFLLLPSGTHGLCGLRYGALPIALPAGSLRDRLVDADSKLETGNGFVIGAAQPSELLATLARALGAYGQRAAFDALRRRAMREDLSWERSARRYEHTYRKLLA